jgi:uncharacterized delta-60 repeat protein
MFTHLKRLTWKASLLMTAISLFAFTIALAASGDLDWTFDHDGLVSTNVSAPMRFENIDDIAIQANGKIIAAGKLHDDDVPNKIALARYHADGSLDKTFSGDGKLITNFSEDYVLTAGVAVQLNGKIVLSGSVCKRDAFMALSCDLMLARYMPNGTLDTTFSGNGWLRLDEGGDNGSQGGLAVLGNGKIVVAGYVPTNGTDMVVYRFLPNGNLDTTFDGDGRVTINFAAGDIPTDLEILNNGKIMILGRTNTGNFTNNFDFALARLNANGSLDSTFGAGGKLIANFGDQDIPSSMAIQSNGKIVVVGHKTNESEIEHIIVARYKTNGILDSTFNGTGKMIFQILPPYSPSSLATDVIVQSDGRIIIAGKSFNGEAFVNVLMRLRPSGGFDTTFSGDGKVIVDIPVSTLALDADGKYVLGGVMSISTISGFRNDFALARILP